MRVAVVLGSAQGPVALLDDALGQRLRQQLGVKGVAYLSASEVRGADPQRPERTLLVSMPWREDTVSVLAELSRTTGARLSVRVVVERQDRVAEHRMVDALRAGEPAVEDPLPELIDHGSTVRTLSQLPFVASVSTCPYELAFGGARGLIAWLDELLADVGLSGRLDLRPLLHTDVPLCAYRSFSPRGLRVGRTLLPELATAAEYELLHDFLVTSFPATEQRLLPAAARAAIVARHRDVNRAFFDAYLPDLPPDSYGSDTATDRLAGVQPTVRVPRRSPRVVARRRAGTIKRAVLRRVGRRDKQLRQPS